MIDKKYIKCIYVSKLLNLYKNKKWNTKEDILEILMILFLLVFKYYFRLEREKR